MVRNATNYGARDALRLHVVDAVAPTLPALLKQIDGTADGAEGVSCSTPRARRSSACT